MATTASTSSVKVAPQDLAYHPPRPRRFAPLNPEKAGLADAGLPKLKGIIFDVDGTLCLPQNYMFKEMRDALQIPKSVDILDHIRSLSNEPDADDSDPATDKQPQSSNNPGSQPSTKSSPQSRASAAIQAIERNAMTSQTPQPGLVELMTYLSSRSILKGLCTRNFPLPVQHLIDEFLTPHGVSFSEPEVVTRETKGVQPKPSPEGIWKIARYWATTHETNGWESTVQEQHDGANEDDMLHLARKYLGSGLIMVGDSVDDMAAGYRAGAATVLLVNEDNEWLVGHEYTDLAVKRLDELVEVLENGFVGNASL